MTKKDYKLIAKAIRQARHDLNNEWPSIFDEIIDNLAFELEADNSAFDADQFRKACEL